MPTRRRRARCAPSCETGHRRRRPHARRPTSTCAHARTPTQRDDHCVHVATHRPCHIAGPLQLAIIVREIHARSIATLLSLGLVRSRSADCHPYRAELFQLLNQPPAAPGLAAILIMTRLPREVAEVVPARACFISALLYSRGPAAGGRAGGWFAIVRCGASTTVRVDV